MKTTCCIGLFSVAITLLGCGSDESDDPDAAMAEAFEALRQAERIPGLTYAVFSADEVLHSRALGLFDARSSAADVDDAYPWLSLTKLVTATAVMMLVETGEIDLDQPYAAYVPQFVAAHPCGTAPTVRHLLSHSAGIPEDLSQLAELGLSGESMPSLAEMAETQLGGDLTHCPGEHNAYSNMTYLLVGYLVEVVRGESYTAFVEREIAGPLKLQARFTQQGIPNRKSVGHLLNDDVYLSLLDAVLGSERSQQLFAAEDDHYHYLLPYDVAGTPFGGVIGPVTDLARFAQSLVGERHALLSEASRDMMQQQHSYDVEAPVAHQAYGLGWRLNLVSELGLMGHDGAGPGFASQLVYSPEHDLGLALFANLTVDEPLSSEDSPTIEFAREFHRRYLSDEVP